MLQRIIAWIVFAAQTVLIWAGIPVTPRGQKLDLDRFTLVWSDEFGAGALDTANWRGHNYTGGASKRQDGWWCLDMAQVRDDNMLHIPSAYFEDGLAGGPAGYYSAGINTKGLHEQKYGYFEARCKLPKGEGLWSAFWMQCDAMGNVDGSGRDGMEIDIYESPYYREACRWKKNAVTSNLHYDGYGEAHRVTNTAYCHVKKPYDTFHTYGLEWNENEYIFYIDGKVTGRSSFGGVSQAPEYLVLSVEHQFKGWAGDIRNNTEMTDFVIDYVRVYQYK